MSARVGHRWGLWLGLLAVAAGITVTLAIVLGGRPNTSGVQSIQQASDATGSSLGFATGRSVPKLLLRRPPVERVAAPVPSEQIAGKESAPTVTAQAQPKDRQSPPDAQASSLLTHGLAQRLRDITGRLQRLKTATGSGGSGP
jgi:hypothetical protein